MSRRSVDPITCSNVVTALWGRESGNKKVPPRWALSSGALFRAPPLAGTIALDGWLMGCVVDGGTWRGRIKYSEGEKYRRRRRGVYHRFQAA